MGNLRYSKAETVSCHLEMLGTSMRIMPESTFPEQAVNIGEENNPTFLAGMIRNSA
jgi:hypothetical protein